MESLAACPGGSRSYPKAVEVQKSVQEISAFLVERVRIFSKEASLEEKAEAALKQLQAEERRLRLTAQKLEEDVQIKGSIQPRSFLDRFITARCDECESQATRLSTIYYHVQRYHGDSSVRCPGMGKRCYLEIRANKKVVQYPVFEKHFLSQHFLSQLSQAIPYQVSCHICKESENHQETFSPEEYVKHQVDKHHVQRVACWVEGCSTTNDCLRKSDLLAHFFLDHVSKEGIVDAQFQPVELIFCKKSASSERERRGHSVRPDEERKRRGRYQIALFELRAAITNLDRRLAEVIKKIGEPVKKQRVAAPTTSSTSHNLCCVEKSAGFPVAPSISSSPLMGMGVISCAGLELGGLGVTSADSDEMFASYVSISEDYDFATPIEIINAFATFTCGVTTFSSFEEAMRYIAKHDSDRDLQCPGSTECRFPVSATEKFIQHFLNMHLAYEVRKINPFFREITCTQCPSDTFYDTVGDLLEHIKYSHRSTLLMCWVPGCDKEYNTRSPNPLRYHVIREHTSKRALVVHSRKPGFQKKNVRVY